MAKKEKIKSMFDNIAPDYDKLNHIMSLNIDKGWRKKAVREIVDKDAPLEVLDVACGTGDDAPGLILIAEASQLIISATELEGTGQLQIFGLDVNIGTKGLGGVQGSHTGDATEAITGGIDLINGNHKKRSFLKLKILNKLHFIFLWRIYTHGKKNAFHGW